MADPELVPEAILEQGGLKVSKSPWGEDDEIGRLNWVTPESTAAILNHLDGRHVFDLNVEYFIGMPSRVAAGDPPYGIWMTHTPQGSINDNLSGVGSEVHEAYSYCGDSIHMYTHCGTHIDTLNHLGFYGRFWNGWTADKDLGSRIWNKGGLEKYPPVISRGVLLDVAGTHGVDVLPDAYAITPQDLQQALAEQKLTLQPGDAVLIHTGWGTLWGKDNARYQRVSPGIGTAAAEWLAKQDPMLVGSDNTAVEISPNPNPQLAGPVHQIMLVVNGIHLLENLRLDELAARRAHEFALIVEPLKIQGGTGSTVAPIAIR